MDNYCNPCAVCGETSPDSFRIWFDGYVKLYRCLKCGFVSQFPGPGAFTIVTDYEDRYSLDFLDEGQSFMYPRRQRTFEDIVERVTRLQASGSILDVGCGDGHFLHLCSKRGLRCYGVEASKRLASYASSRTGAQTVQGLYNKEMFPENCFDVVSFIQVLEHIPTPIAALETAQYHLHSGGLLVVEVPSIQSPHCLAYQWTGIKWFVRPPFGVISSHFGYYSPKTLTALTARSGFKKVSLITGRWQSKYSLPRQVGRIIDSLLNAIRVGGILYFGVND